MNYASAFAIEYPFIDTCSSAQSFFISRLALANLIDIFRGGFRSCSTVSVQVPHRITRLFVLTQTQAIRWDPVRAGY
jgi:hypothetical protein